MTEDITRRFRVPETAKGLADQIARCSRRDLRLMEVCGTHTVSIFRNGIRSLLPDSISLVSGPGCPVCVTDQRDIDAFIALSRLDGVVIATFGDLMRVPGSQDSLLDEKASGRDIRVVYSPLDALDLARRMPDRKVIFLGVGFETTAPAVAAVLASARREGIKNFFVYSAHKRVLPALFALSRMPDLRVDGFLLPGHVSVVIGAGAYLPFVTRSRLPAVVAGFEPVEILYAIHILATCIESGAAELANAYPRAVTWEGNRYAQALLEEAFEPVDAFWRGLGIIPESGYALRPDFAAFDAERMFEITPPPRVPSGCRCGDILTGRITPPDCPLFGAGCTPGHPAGPCMVSGEGTCAAFYKYNS